MLQNACNKKIKNTHVAISVNYLTGSLKKNMNNFLFASISLFLSLLRTCHGQLRFGDGACCPELVRRFVCSAASLISVLPQELVLIG